MFQTEVVNFNDMYILWLVLYQLRARIAQLI